MTISTTNWLKRTDVVSNGLEQAVSAVPRLPAAPADFLRNRRILKQELLKQSNLLAKRIAILGGSTTIEVKNDLEVFLLAHGILPTFYESGYNRYYEDVLSENQDLWDFRPEIVFIHTSWQNVAQFPELGEPAARVEERIGNQMAQFESIWEKIDAQLGAVIIQNNFDLPALRPLGNLEATEAFGRVNFLLRLNAEFANYARNHPRFLINDILYLSSQLGLAAWHDSSYWYRFHMAVSPISTVSLSRNVAGLVKSLYGKSKKCLVVDLDNTLWGGVIGDDGLENLTLGRENPLGEAFLDFQRYVKALQRRGVILAVCSKNDLEVAKNGFSHPDSVLKIEDFSAFRANWNPKPENIRSIALELNIGLDSIVFVDDNPAERAFVAEALPEVAVPDVGSDVSVFAGVLERERYFDVGKLVPDDIHRAAFYASNAERSVHQVAFGDYEEFLASLEMNAEIAPFCPLYLERITQLINKTNQFNLTTRRYTSAEVGAISFDNRYLTLYGRLADRFGDNGLVSVIIGRVTGDSLEVDTWLMSCRVLKREFELAMFDALVEQCQARGIRKIVGVHVPSKKNGMVAGHYASLGFQRAGETPEGADLWQFDVLSNYTPQNRYIRRAVDALAIAG